MSWFTSPSICSAEEEASRRYSRSSGESSPRERTSSVKPATELSGAGGAERGLGWVGWGWWRIQKLRRGEG